MKKNSKRCHDCGALLHRKSTAKIRPICVLVTNDDFRDIQEAVVKTGASQSEIIRRAVRFGLPLLLDYQRLGKMMANDVIGEAGQKILKRIK